jgi:hypothetical protein
MKYQNTHFVLSIFFFENRSIYEIMGKNIVQRGRSQMTIWHMCIACWIPKALLFHCCNCYMNVLQCYIVCTLPVLLLQWVICIFSLPPMPRSSKMSRRFKRWTEIFFSLFPISHLRTLFPVSHLRTLFPVSHLRTLFPIHPWCDFAVMWWSVHIIKLSIMQLSPTSITSFLLDPNVLLRTLLFCIINIYCPCVMLFWWHIHCPNDQVLQILFQTTL